MYAHRSAQMRVCLHEASYGYNAFGCACACMSFLYQDMWHHLQMYNMIVYAYMLFAYVFAHAHAHVYVYV